MWRLSAVLFLVVAVATASSEKVPPQENENQIESELPHPDPNEEDHEGMIYIGRTCHRTGRRLLANESYAVQYIFGSSFEEEETKKETETDESKLKRFGHVETHSLDGGIVPQQLVTVEPFYMDAKPVSNADFAKFVARTYYRTEAELFGWSYVLDSMIQYIGSDHIQSLHHDGEEYRNLNRFERDPVAQYWTALPFVNWKEPYGQRTKYSPDHPVVHVSHRDAAEYCQWRNQARLPGEREYEAASRWSLPPRKDDTDTTEQEVESYIPPRTMYAWGNMSDWNIAYEHANLWGIGDFPDENGAVDGYFGTSPVGTYPPNALGFYDLTGNVWEWMRGGSAQARIVRGSSFVDSLDGTLNHAATLGSRATTHGTTTTGNIGFRCAKSVTKRMEHHWTWHDIDVDGPLSSEDEYIDESTKDKNKNDDDDDDETDGQRKKKKVPIRNEQIRTEL